MDAVTARDEYAAIARYYDLIYGQRQDDVAMYVDFAAVSSGPILELGCGTGRVLVPLAEAGHSVTGVDSSTSMLAVARNKVEEAGLQKAVSLVTGNLTDFELPDRFDMAFIPINTFMHCYDQSQQLRCLEAIRRHLKPGGRLVIDVYHPDPQSLVECDGRLVCENIVEIPDTGRTLQHSYTRRLDRAEQTQHITFIFDETDERGQTERTYFFFRMRFVYRFEMELLLRTSGFGVEALYGSYELEPFDSSSEKMIFVARADWAV